MGKQNKKLVEQSEALTNFFESLMNDVNAYQGQTQPDQHTDDDHVTKEENNIPVGHESLLDSEINLEPTDNKIQPEPALAETAAPHTIISEPDVKLFETLPPVMPESVVIEEIKPVTGITDGVTGIVDADQAVENKALSEDLPDWCQHEFQAMLFNVAGLTLAVPLVDLNGVVECDLNDVTAMPGHADFYLGLMQYLDKNVPLVDTAKFVLPADKLSTLAGDEPVVRITRAVLIHDCQYGLACDEVNEVVTLKPEDVRWRTQRTQRRWLAGTVIEHMCALIDATAFAELLADQTPVQAFRE